MKRKKASALLGVREGATMPEVLSAYRTRAAKCHPDLAGGNKDEFIRLGEAKRRLLDPSPDCARCRDTGYVLVAFKPSPCGCAE